MVSMAFRHLGTHGKYSVFIIKYSGVYVKETLCITSNQDSPEFFYGEGNTMFIPEGQTFNTSFFECAETRKCEPVEYLNTE